MVTYRGIVSTGEGRAALLGFPTINIACEDAPSGIYAAKVAVANMHFIAAAFADPARHLLEAHLIGFDGDLYGTEAAITLEKKIRDSAPYTDDAALSAAIAADVVAVTNYFQANESRE